MRSKIYEGVFGIALAFFSYVFAIFFTGLFLSLAWFESGESTAFGNVLLGTVFTTASLGIIFGGLNIAGRTSWLRLKKPAKGSYPALLVAFMVYYFLLFVSFFVLQEFISEETLNEAQDIGFEIKNIPLKDSIFTGLLLIVVVPLGEELLYRGLLFSSFLKLAPPVLAAVIVSILFGVAHGQLNVGIDTFILSMIACFLVYKYKSIWPAIILHASKNAVAFLLITAF